MADFFWTSYSDNDMVGVWYLRLFWIADFGFRIGDWRGTDFAKATADSLLGAARRNKYVILPNEPTDFEVKMRIYVFGWQWVVRRRKAFFRWVRFPKRTHRKGILRGKMMNFGTEFGAIFGCGIMRARGWLGLWGDLRSIVVRGRETRAQPEKSGHDGAWPSTKPGTTKIKDWRLGTRRLPGLTLRRGDGIQCQAWVHLTS